MAEVEGCTSEDVKKCEFIVTTLNDTLNAAGDLLSSIETKRKVLYKGDQKLLDEVLYLTTAKSVAASGTTTRTAADIN